MSSVRGFPSAAHSRWASCPSDTVTSLEVYLMLGGSVKDEKRGRICIWLLMKMGYEMDQQINAGIPFPFRKSSNRMYIDWQKSWLLWMSSCFLQLKGTFFFIENPWRDQLLLCTTTVLSRCVKLSKISISSAQGWQSCTISSDKPEVLMASSLCVQSIESKQKCLQKCTKYHCKVGNTLLLHTSYDINLVVCLITGPLKCCKGDGARRRHPCLTSIFLYIETKLDTPPPNFTELIH